MSRYFERGGDCSSDAPFSNFECVCVLKNVPTGWKALANTPMTLPEFIYLCEHLSHKQNWSSADGIISTKFETYTGKLLNPLNVSAAFNDGVLYPSQSLEEKLLAKQKQGNGRCRGIMHGRVDQHAPLYPDWCTQFGVEVPFSQYHSTSCGCSKDDKIGGDGRSPSGS